MDRKRGGVRGGGSEEIVYMRGSLRLLLCYCACMVLRGGG